MAIESYDDLIEAVGAGKWQWQPFYGDKQSTHVQLGGTNAILSIGANTAILPGSLPSGITDFLVSSAYVIQSGSFSNILLAKVVDLGSLDISGASGTFTDGNAMPSEVELGNSAASIAGPVWIDVTTALNATPGSFTITYTNQSGTGGQVSTSQALGASSPIRSSGWVTLASGDTGVRDITASARTAGTTPTGVIKFWGVVPICMLFVPVASVGDSRDLISSAFNPYPLSAGDSLMMFMAPGATARGVSGGVYLIGGS